MLEQFFASRPAMIERDRNHIRKCIEILRDKHISMPVLLDYENIRDKVLIPEIMKLPRVRTEKTAEGYMTSFNKYNLWLIEQQKGVKQMPSPLENEESKTGMATEETVSEVSSVSDSENIEAISDTRDIKESENVSDINDTQAVEKSEHTESMKATKNSENVSDTPDTKKTNKKGNREQISLYIDRDIYTSLKRIAKIEDTTITEIIGKLLAVFVKKNIEVLCENEEILSQMKRFEY